MSNPIGNGFKTVAHAFESAANTLVKVPQRFGHNIVHLAKHNPEKLAIYTLAAALSTLAVSVLLAGIGAAAGAAAGIGLLVGAVVFVTLVTTYNPVVEGVKKCANDMLEGTGLRFD